MIIFVFQLLQKDVTRRLGVVSDIKRHQFFASIDFEKLEKRQIEPPFKPKVVSIQTGCNNVVWQR